MKRLLFVFLALLTLATTLWGVAGEVAIPPTPQRWVTDRAGFLSDAARSSLDARLEGYEQQSGHQILVYIDQTTGPVPIEDWGVKAFEKWKVGRKGMDDGLVLFVMAQDHKARIEVGYGLEGTVPDAIASRILRDVLAPKIQEGDRDGAVTAAVDALTSAIGGQGSSEPAPSSQGRQARGSKKLSFGQKIIVGLVIAGFLVLLITNPSLAIWLLFNILSGGGSGGGGGGGGFSGGGGRSGGGGASGSW